MSPPFFGTGISGDSHLVEFLIYFLSHAVRQSSAVLSDGGNSWVDF
jgi:hypothetical protein